MESESLDKFGKFLVENLRDKGIEYAERLMAKQWKAPSVQKLQNDLDSFTPEQKEVVRETVISAIDTAIHDFLFALQEQADFDDAFQIIADGENIVEISDGIHGEAYSEEGWYAKFSKYKTME